MSDANPPAAALSRQPRGAVKVNGAPVGGWVEFAVDNNRMAAADTFSVRFAVGDMVAPQDAAWLVAQASIMVELFANDVPLDPDVYVAGPSDILILGRVDHVRFDPVDREIELEGRDLTALLIDTKTSENHQNETSSDVATLLAGRRGLKPVVTATTTRIGQYYEIDHADINQEQSEWDLLSKLAKYENFDVYVLGDELHFEPKPADGAPRYAIDWTLPSGDEASPSANVASLNLSRDLTIAKGITVTVRSWNAKQGKAFSATWPKAIRATRPGQATNDTLAYGFTIPGLTQDQAFAEAKSRYDQIIQHAVQLNAELPGDGILSCAMSIVLRGTGTIFDQVYYPDSVRRSMSAQGGYTMSLSAKNLSQDIEAAGA